MHRRISPILIAAVLLSGGFPTRREEDEEPAKDPELPERDEPRETYDGRNLLTLEPPRATPPQFSPVASRTYHEPRPRPVKRTHAPRNRAAQRAAKKIKSAAKKRRGR